MEKNYSVLRAMPYAQARVVREPNAIVLISYQTAVAAIIGGCLIVNGLYSATTRRHIGAFCREYCGCDYYVAKKCYQEKLCYDIVTRQYAPVILDD